MGNEEEEISLRQSPFAGLTPGTVAYLQQMLYSHNSYVESLKMAHEISLTKQPSKLHRTPTTGRQTTTVSLPINHTYCTTRPPYATSIAHNPKQTSDTPLPVLRTGSLASNPYFGWEPSPDSLTSEGFPLMK